MDILNTWSMIDVGASRLHAVGQLEPPWDQLLEQHNTGNIVHHGWIDSHTNEYQRIIKTCKFAHIPTYSEGQMGTLLEVIFSGCIPITTRASGVDDHVLDHCLLVEPSDVEQQRRAIYEALSWSDAEYEERIEALAAAASRYHNWIGFRDAVSSTVRGLAALQTA
jgi:glycosyltransferase involved in cell wall biosynthesis